MSVLGQLLELLACVIDYRLFVLDLIICIYLAGCLLHLLLDQLFVYFGDVLENYLRVRLRGLLVLSVYLVLVLAHVVQLLDLEHLLLHVAAGA